MALVFHLLIIHRTACRRHLSVLLLVILIHSSAINILKTLTHHAASIFNIHPICKVLSAANSLYKNDCSGNNNHFYLRKQTLEQITSMGSEDNCCFLFENDYFKWSEVIGELRTIKRVRSLSRSVPLTVLVVRFL